MIDRNEHCCSQMNRHLIDSETAIHYSARFREYGIRILDGGDAYQLIDYCPWCGSRLPASLRNEWFDIADEIGLDASDPSTPEEMMSDAWWRQRGL